MAYNLGFKQNDYGPDIMSRELEYWRGLLNNALNTARKARRPYVNIDALRESLRLLEVYWLGESRDKSQWNAVCDSAYRQITVFNQWANRQ